MPLIIDTYNVLHVVGVLPPDIAGIDVRGLVALIAHSRYRRRRTTLVCDGVPGEDAPTGPTGPIEVRYSGHGRTADDLIARLVGVSTAPRRLTVVSDDRAVLATARRRRCDTLGSRDFLRQLAADHRARPPASSVPPGELEGTPATPVLPTTLVQQAMEIAAAAEAQEARAEADRAAQAERDAAADRPDDASSTEATDTDPSRAYAAVLPVELIAQAETLAASADVDRPSEPEAPSDGPSTTDSDAGSHPFADTPTPRPADPLFDRRILEEAESLLRDDHEAAPEADDPPADREA